MYKIVVPICNRTNYSKLRPVLLKLNKTGKVDINIVTSSDMAIDKRANAIADIIDDGLIISNHIDCLMSNDTLDSMSKTMGLSLIEHSSIMTNMRPDAMLLVGDRFDILPSVLSAKLSNIPIFHIQGGERSGSIDDTVRDMITICADRHYVSTEKSYENVKKIAKTGHIFNYGCPSVESIVGINIGMYLDVKTFKKKYKNSFGIAPYEKYILVMVHPNTSNEHDVDMDALLSSVLSFRLKTIVMYPNIDPFNTNILKGMKDYNEMIIRVRHMPIEDFVKVLAHASCMVGNSSSGIREAASFGTPVVNVGQRQMNRERNANTLDCGSSYEEVRKNIEKSLKIERYEPNNIYYKKDCSLNISNDIIQYLDSMEK